jgi:DNA-binding IclR family transcriptional regulator
LTSTESRPSDDRSVERHRPPRCLRILTPLEQADGEPMPLAWLARGIKAARSSTSILCRVLEHGRMIARTATGSVLGPWASRDRSLAIGASLTAVQASDQFVAAIVEELRLAVDRLSKPLIRRPITG